MTHTGFFGNSVSYRLQFSAVLNNNDPAPLSFFPAALTYKIVDDLNFGKSRWTYAY